VLDNRNIEYPSVQEKLSVLVRTFPTTFSKAIYIFVWLWITQYTYTIRIHLIRYLMFSLFWMSLAPQKLQP